MQNPGKCGSLGNIMLVRVQPWKVAGAHLLMLSQAKSTRYTFVVICFPAYSTAHTALFSMVNNVPCFVSMYEWYRDDLRVLLAWEELNLVLNAVISKPLLTVLIFSWGPSGLAPTLRTPGLSVTGTDEFCLECWKRMVMLVLIYEDDWGSTALKSSALLSVFS